MLFNYVIFITNLPPTVSSIVSRFCQNSLGAKFRCFAAAGPRLSNTLPVHLRQCDSIGQFKRLLMTHLFGVWDRGAL